MIILFITLLLFSAGTGFMYWKKLQQQEHKKASDVFIARYPVLYNLLTQRRQATILRAKTHIITVQIELNGDLHLITLEELDERLSITWKLKSKEFGMLTKEWSFNPRHSQNWMYDEILHDIRAIQLQKIRHLKNAEKIKLRAA